MVFSESGAILVQQEVWEEMCRTGLRLASDLVAGAGYRFLGLVERGLGRVGGLDSVSLDIWIAGGETYQLLAGLGVEVFAECFGHVCCWCLFGLRVVVVEDGG